MSSELCAVKKVPCVWWYHFCLFFIMRCLWDAGWMDGALGRRVPALSQAAGGFFGGRLAWVHWGGGAWVRQGWLLDSTNSLSSSGRTRVEGGRPLPSPVACETLGRLVSGCWPSSTRSSTAGRWRWHRRRGRTCPHSVPPGTRRTSGRPRRTAWPPPGKKKKKKNLNKTAF